MFSLNVEDERLFTSKLNGLINYKSLGLIKGFLVSFFLIFKALTCSRKLAKSKSTLVFYPTKQEDLRSLRELVSPILGNQEFEIYSYSQLQLPLIEAIKVGFLSLRCFFSGLFLRGEKKGTFLKGFVPFIHANIAIYPVRSQSPDELLIYGFSYSLESFFFSTLCKQEPTLKTMAYIASPYLSAGDHLVADNVILCNPWYKYVKNGFVESIFPSSKISYSKSENYPKIPSFVHTYPKERRTNIAILSSGMYKRSPLNFDCEINMKNDQLWELKLKKLISDYAQKFPSLNFVLFPHPIETEKETRSFWNEILLFPNVSLADSGKPSSQSYTEFELGIANSSLTILERLERGHKAAYLYDGPAIVPLKPTPLGKIIISDIDQAIEKFEAIRTMKREDFFRTIDFMDAYLENP